MATVTIYRPREILIQTLEAEGWSTVGVASTENAAIWQARSLAFCLDVHSDSIVPIRVVERGYVITQF